MKEARSSYFTNLINCNRKNPRVLFEPINSIVLSPPEQTVILCDDGCNTFLNQFVNKEMDLRSKSSSPYEEGPQHPESITLLAPIALNDLATIMGKMKPSSFSLENNLEVLWYKHLAFIANHY